MHVCAWMRTHVCTWMCVPTVHTHMSMYEWGGRGRIQGFSTHLPFLHQRLHLGEVHVLQFPRHGLAVTRLQRDRGQQVSNSG